MRFMRISGVEDLGNTKRGRYKHGERDEEGSRNHDYPLSKIAEHQPYMQQLDTWERPTPGQESAHCTSGEYTKRKGICPAGQDATANPEQVQMGEGRHFPPGGMMRIARDFDMDAWQGEGVSRQA
jgi:hypothetical protein